MSDGGGGGGATGFPPLDWALWFIQLIFDPKKLIKYVGDWGVSRALFLTSVYVGLFLILGHQIPNLPAFALKWMFGLAPIWMPFFLWICCWNAWVWYIQALFISGRNPVLLEMKVPREIMKSPRAMELALTSFSVSSGETTFIHRGWKGQVRTQYSLEMASFGGEVHFYIWCWKNYRNMVESALYAQYPEIELVEVEDYASKFQYDPEVHSAFATDWRRETYMSGFEAGSRDLDAYPIRTYVDFELEKDPKEEFKVEPLAQVIEYLGSIKPNEQAWLQIVFRKAGNYDGVLLPKALDDEWKEAVHNQVENVRRQAMRHGHESDADLEAILHEGGNRFPHPTDSQKEQLQAIERNYGKFPFEVGMRGIYITTGDLHGPTYSGMRYLWRPFNNPQYRTQLRPRRWMNDFDYPWQDIGDVRNRLFTRRFLDAFRRRSFFTSPWKTPTFVMTNEEIASIWHPPSATVQTPGLERIPATKASAPSNLPR